MNVAILLQQIYSQFNVVGGMNDFRDVPGLANLVAYSLIVGSRKYPTAFDFNKFLMTNNGASELPITKTHDQLFSFDVKSTRLAAALDRYLPKFAVSLCRTRN